MDGNGVANILDIIQLINLILDNRTIDFSPQVGKANINIESVNEDLYIRINSDKDFSGVQFNIVGEFNEIELLNNSHILNYVK